MEIAPVQEQDIDRRAGKGAVPGSHRGSAPELRGSLIPIPFREPQSGSPTEIPCQWPDSRIPGRCRGEPGSIKRPRLAELAASPTHRSAA